jgi:hypothetical protein
MSWISLEKPGFVLDAISLLLSLEFPHLVCSVMCDRMVSVVSGGVVFIEEA